jgi:hypothetical protein
MIEKSKPINNPLTIIAIFAALAEVASTVSLKLITPELQYIFIWFVIGFPLLIVLVFFYILCFKTNVLYAPSDYRDDQTFITAIGIQKVAIIGEVREQLDTAKKQILDDVIKEIGDAAEKERESLKELVNQRLSPVQDNVEKYVGDVVGYVTDYYVKGSDGILASINAGKYLILKSLFNSSAGKMSPSELISTVLPVTSADVFSTALLELVKDGFVKEDGGELFITSDSTSTRIAMSKYRSKSIGILSTIRKTKNKGG